MRIHAKYKINQIEKLIEREIAILQEYERTKNKHILSKLEDIRNLQIKLLDGKDIK
jgi:hypothetical protein